MTTDPRSSRPRSWRWPLLVAVAVLALPGEPAAYEAITVTGGSSVSGTIRFTGKAPAVVAPKVEKDADFCGPRVAPRPDVITGSGGGLKDAVVFLRGVKKGRAAAPGRARLDNRGCRYAPHVQAFAAGTILDVKNFDPILHNSHGVMRKTDVFNLGLPEKNQIIEQRIDRPGLIKVRCDAGHTWMSAFIAVFDHPYFAVTADDGAFRLDGVPAGSYTLVVWHGKLGSEKQKIEVVAGEALDLKVVLR